MTKTHDKRTETHACDLISRQAAIDEIKAVYEWHDTVTVDRLIQHFKALPAADAVPVVRCKDCKHRSTEDNVWVCPFGLPGGPEFFCGYGVDGKDGDHEKAD